LLLDDEVLMLEVETLLLEVEVEVEVLMLEVEILVLDDCWTVLDVEIVVLLDGTMTEFETAAAAAGLKRYKSSLVLYKLSFLI
jgi:hypothetical protein